MHFIREKSRMKCIRKFPDEPEMMHKDVPLVKFKKKNPKILSIIIWNQGCKFKKRSKKLSHLSTVSRTAAVLGTFKPLNLMKFIQVVAPPKNPTAGKKMWPNSTYKGPRALALILAFTAVSKA